MKDYDVALGNTRSVTVNVLQSVDAGRIWSLEENRDQLC